MKPNTYLLLILIILTLVLDIYIFSSQLQGTGFLAATRCIEGWQCKDANTYGFLTKKCEWAALKPCSYDCGPDGCISQPSAVAGITRLTANDRIQALPRISGNNVVYWDARNSDAVQDTDIYYYNFASNTEDKIITAGGPVCDVEASKAPKACERLRDQAVPDISDDMVVFEDYSRLCNFFGDKVTCPLIYEYEINEKKAKPISNRKTLQYAPRISGKDVVWFEIDPDKATFSVVWQNLENGSELNLGPGQYPAISGNLIVYMPFAGDKLQLFDTSTLQSEELPVAGVFPEIYDNKIVYSRFDVADNGTNIYIYDLSTKTEKKINSVTTKIAGGQAIYGNEIVYHALRDGYVKIVLYNIATETESIIDDSQYNQTNPSIFENKIVYEKEVDGNKDIYLYTIG